MVYLPIFFRRFRAIASVVLALPAIALAQDDDISVAIAKHADLTSGGAVVIRVHIACDPPPGTEEFQEAFAGAGQARNGVDGESGIDGMIVCDGFAHTHTAHISPITEAQFKRGPANASVSVFICNVVGDQQLCISGAAQRRIIVRGRLVP